MSDNLKAAPGDVVGETEHSTTYIGATAATFEGIASSYIYICFRTIHHIIGLNYVSLRTVSRFKAQCVYWHIINF